MSRYSIVKITKKNRQKVEQIIEDNWISTDVYISDNKLVDCRQVDGFVACDGGNILGVITYIMYDKICEIVTLNSLESNKGIGTALCNELIEYAKKNNCKFIKVITTNDNLNALKFYQKRGFCLKEIFPNALEYVRKKKSIPLIGENNIPLRDTIELEMVLC